MRGAVQMFYDDDNNDDNDIENNAADGGDGGDGDGDDDDDDDDDMQWLAGANFDTENPRIPMSEEELKMSFKFVRLFVTDRFIHVDLSLCIAYLIITLSDVFIRLCKVSAAFSQDSVTQILIVIIILHNFTLLVADDICYYSGKR